MTCQAIKNRSEMKQITKEESYVHTKRILAVAISNIAYIRSLFPDSYFTERDVDDMKVRVITTNENTQDLIDWMSGVFDAIRREYLKTLELWILADKSDPNSVIESYSFNFRYAEGVVKTDLEMNNATKPLSVTNSMKETKKSTQKFIKNLVLLTSSLNHLPDEVYTTMRLAYYEETTPGDYHPKGFMDDDSTSALNAPRDFVHYDVGQMNAPFHTMQLTMGTRQDPDDDSSIEEIPQQQAQYQEKPIDVTTIEQMEVITDCLENEAPRQQTQSTQGLGVRCPCGFNEDDGSMLMCDACKYWQHAICFCVTEDARFTGVHICENCGDTTVPGLFPTDITLLSNTEKERRVICTWRRALQACYETSRITVLLLSIRLSCTKVLAKEIVARLEKEGVVKSVKGQRQKKEVDKFILESVFREDVRILGSTMMKQRNELGTQNNKGIGFTQPSSSQTRADCDETPVKFEERNKMDEMISQDAFKKPTKRRLDTSMNPSERNSKSIKKSIGKVRNSKHNTKRQ